MSKFRVVVLLAVVALLLFPAMALADGPPERPCRFWGTVTVDGDPVDDGTSISAMIGGVAVGNDTTPYLAGPSTYSIMIEQPEGADYGNATVTFTIGDRTADQADTWLPGKNEELNLTVGEAGPVSGEIDVIVSWSDGNATLIGDVLTLYRGPQPADGATGATGDPGAPGEDGEDAAGGIALPIVALIIAIIAAGVAMMSMRRRV